MLSAFLLSFLVLSLPSAAKPALAADFGNVREKRADDISIGALQTLVEQHASTLQALQAELMASDNRVNTLQASHDALQRTVASLQSKLDSVSTAVAFSARISGNLDAGGEGVSLGYHQIVVFNETVTNIANAYNTGTGIFTAPVDGLYAFFLTQMTPNTHGHLFLDIIKNGNSVLDEVFSEGGTADNYDQGSSLVTTRLATADQVWVRLHSGDAVRASYWTVFTGFLLQAE